jgi:hypothetical protein
MPGNCEPRRRERRLHRGKPADFGLDNPSHEELLDEAWRIAGPSGTLDLGMGHWAIPGAIAEAMREVDFLGRTL